MGSHDQASSPSFTLQNVYRLPAGEMHHFDFYRLDEPGLMADELQQSIDATDVITVVEWANIVRDVLPPEHLRIEISSTGDTSRLFTITASPSVSHLLEGLR